MSKTFEKRAEQQAAEHLRALFPPGSTVYTVLRHVSRSGMSRSISVLHQDADGISDVSYLVARVLGDKLDRERGGVKVRGCGMDMGRSLVYNLSATLHPEGFGCIGEGCPSNDHSNGDRDYTPHSIQYTPETCPGRPCGAGCDHKSGEGRDHWHRYGGYALRHRWI